METLGAEGQWTSLSGIYTAEEADFMALLLSNSVPHDNQLLSSMGTLPSFWPGHGSTTNAADNYGGSHCSLELSNSGFCSFSRGSSSTSGDNSNDFPTSSTNNICSVSLAVGVGDFMATTSYLVEGDSEDHREIGDGSECVAQKKKVLGLENKSSPSEENSAKRSQCSENAELGKRYGKLKKKQKLASINDDEGGNTGANNGQISRSCCSGDDSINGGEEMSGGGDTSNLSPKGPATLNSHGKTRARRGSATDPQSVYARRRRERINERLRILQNLVPNGTKVDISTMLEEAVQYVKFLQLQIKLLSSDELWMYAPIAYNGMDIGLDHLKLAVAKKS